MTISIRPALETDAAAIVALLNPIIAAGGYTIIQGPLSVANQLDFMRSFPERGVFHVAVDDDSQTVVGLQDVQALAGGSPVFRHVGEVSTFVALDHQQSGFGHRLSRATFQAAKAHGFRKIWAAIRADNPRAVAFYLSQGFRIVGTAQQHAFVEGRYVDEILAEKLID